jgi:hypothetical protein
MLMETYKYQPAPWQPVAPPLRERLRACSFPGRAVPAGGLFLAADYGEAECRQLLQAVFIRAVRDAANRQNTPRREDARAWLLETGSGWAGMVGIRVNQAMIEAWALEGWPRRRAGSPKLNGILKR